MTLADTSVWVGHFRKANTRLQRLLDAGEVTTHAMVIGELACGSLHRRTATLELLGNLPRIPLAPDEVVMEAIAQQRLWSRGLGWVDLHLLVASRIFGVGLWTLDQRLAQLA
jgi:hypothetical protein